MFNYSRSKSGPLRLMTQDASQGVILYYSSSHLSAISIDGHLPSSWPSSILIVNYL